MPSLGQVGASFLGEHTYSFNVTRKKARQRAMEHARQVKAYLPTCPVFVINKRVYNNNSRASGALLRPWQEKQNANA
jgi:hypothetical protein